MLLNSFEFFVFLLLVSILYFIVPKKAKALILLIASIVFYLLWNVFNTVILILTALSTYAIGILMDQVHLQAQGAVEATDLKPVRRKKRLLILGIVLLVGELFFYKYYGFTALQINILLSSGGNPSVPMLADGIFIPLGISFYIFQTIGYLVDVYRGKVKAERNVIDFLLFITFFPKIIQGPIERADGFLEQIHKIEEKGRFDIHRVCNGLITFIWGLFIKMVIADRIAIVVDQVFSTYFVYGTVELAFAAIGYAIQIYCDFAGYSAMALGAAQVFGFDLIDNFNVPYFSVSTREFWRRWHISLSAWFRDYVYIPLGGSRRGKWRKRLNVMLVMLVSGIWHGAGWSFIFWGLLHGAYQVAGEISAPKLQKRLNTPVGSASQRLGSMIVTFVLVDIAWIFFRAPRLMVALDYIRIMFSRFNPWVLFDGSLLKLGLDQIEMNVLTIALPMLVIVDYIQYKKAIRIDRMLENQCLWFRWAVIILLFTLIWVCGEYGPAFNSSSFIYQSF